MTPLLKMASKLEYRAKDVMCQIDQSSSPPTKQRLWDATIELLSKWVEKGGKRDELLRALQARHLTEPAEIVSTAIQQEPGLADSFSFTTMDSEGGDIQLGEGDVQVSLPPGALGEETCEVVTVKVPNHAPELICDEEEIQASPPVQCTPSGLTFDEPVKLTVPHCTSLDNITDETEVILYTSHGTADYTREELSQDDYTITDDSVVVNVRHFSTFRISMKKLRGVKFGFLPFHPSIMPRSRKPILQVFFYQMYKRNESKICEEHEHLNQEFCKAAPPTEVSMDTLNEDLTIVCSDGAKEIKEEIAHTRLRERKSNKTSFELDFGKEEYGSKNIRITLFQGSHKLETSLFEVRMQEPEPTMPQQVAPDPFSTVSFEGCGTTPEEEMKLLELSEEIPNNIVVKLSMKLGFSHAKAMRYASTNVRGVAVDSTGTLVMLQEWLKKTKPQFRNDSLEKALVDCDLVESAEFYIPITEVVIDTSVLDDVHEEDEAGPSGPSGPRRLVQHSESSGYVGMVSSKHHGDYRIKSVTKRDSRKQSVKSQFSHTE
ncbi:uncharacterized protein LOC100892969 [Strongylocentrotus purpuratus]|uniref:ZU5 domain-containing protein n=1 Tax=Strongylocentrotus purpuratus TaxID=7668 RepID=A0A7M7T4S1_STRPU|nr:uncharacterized protein LOC100892969 [Strongylocentrotus purpuratus]